MRPGAVWFAWCLYWAWMGTVLADPPSFASTRAAQTSSDAVLLDRLGQPLHQWRVDESRRQLAWIPLAEISPAVRQTIVAVEDKRFLEHGGVDWVAVLGSFRERLTGGPGRGASTLTMQLATLLDLAPRRSGGRRTWGEKWTQMKAAWDLEESWRKEEILEAYLNLVTFRGELRGISAASRALFDKHPSGLDQQEALILTALLRSPNAKPLAVGERACLLARRFVAQGAATWTPYSHEVNCSRLQELAASRLTGAYGPIRQEVAWAPHAARKLWRESPAASRRLSSTLDGSLQRFAVQALAQQLVQLAGRNVRDGAVLVADNASGQVLAYVGNGGNQPDVLWVDGVLAPRQAGSTLKPFLYELALEKRVITAASLLHDAPLELAVPSGLYVPRNHDQEYRGWVSARMALASSLNVPAVRVLLLMGLEHWVTRLRQLGFDGVTEEGSYYGYALALGSPEVTLWQLVQAYRALAVGGGYRPLVMLADQETAGSKPVMAEPAVFIVNDILSDPAARGLTFGLDNPLATSFWSVAKTGTSKQMRDNWCLGFTRRHTVGVWMGNFDGEPMEDVSGITGAAPLWLEIMTYLAEGEYPASPSPPAGVARMDVTFQPALEAPRREWFLTGTEMAEVRLQRGDHFSATILQPLDGTILALDPDIPPERQRVFFRASGEGANHSWRLDGKPYDKDGWSPTPGSHRLELLQGGDRVLDAIAFQVRGPKSAK